MAVQTFSLNRDFGLAQSRWKELGDGADEALAALRSSGRMSVAEVDAFASAVNTEIGAPQATTAPGETPQATTAAGEEPAPRKSSSLLLLLGILCVVLVVVGGALAYFLMGRGKRGSGELTPAQASVKFNRAAEPTDYVQQGQETPVAQFMTTYTAGDDLYDDSFSIDSPTGEFLGECGVGISETIGVGDPKKVTAFEVWLFDKNDIQTVTKVLMSAHAYEDPTISQRLESKGEPVLAEPGKHILLETATLQLEARVVDMSFGQGALPTNSFFDRLTLELAVWPKVAAEA